MNKPITRQDLEAALGREMLRVLREQENPMLGVKRLPGDKRLGGRKREGFQTLVTLARSAVGPYEFTASDIARTLGINLTTAHRIVVRMNNLEMLEFIAFKRRMKVWKATHPARKDTKVLDRARAFLSKWGGETFTTVDVREMMNIDRAPAIRLVNVLDALGLVEDTGKCIGRSGKTVVWRIKEAAE